MFIWKMIRRLLESPYLFMPCLNSLVRQQAVQLTKYSLVILLLCPFSAYAGESMSNYIMEKYTNALIDEASPYLQQHAHNPVHWYPWGEEAFAKAEKENKPIFLSIGYSTCHWCHVMEHESFEDEEVAAAMNQSFISIKVDREERPDIDQVYMQVAQMMNGSGGWPLNILMTPDKKPFYAGTYIPKYSRGQHIGMLDLSVRVSQLWQQEQGKLEASAEKISQLLATRSGVSEQQAVKQGALALDLDIKAIKKQVIDDLKQSFDAEYGGFGSAPKFPSPHKLLFLLRQVKESGDKQVLNMLEKTLDAMRAGGIFDQIGFGFHRYATDAEWLLPHFEKMLYDQAMLMMAYTEAYQLTGHARHAQVVREIAEYVLRDMRDSSGGFYSAEDADSDGVEGKFYVWETSEIEHILDAQQASLAKQTWQLQADGNFHDEATGQKTAENIPHLSVWKAGVIDSELETIRQKLFAVREKRVHPFRDDKILTDWNGLMIAALSKASRALQEPSYLQAAKQCSDFLLNTMQGKDGRLLHRYRQGDAAIDGHLDDYAFLIWGLLELYETDFDAHYLQAALALNAHMMEKFTGASGGLYLTSNDAEELLVRPMEAWDGALPSGNAVAAMNMLRLARMTSDSDLENAAYAVFGVFADLLKKVSIGLVHMVSAYDFANADGIEIVLAGDRKSVQPMIDALHGRYLPHAVVLWRNEVSMTLVPYIKMQKAIDDKATAYVCENFQCKQPVTDVRAMMQLLDME